MSPQARAAAPKPVRIVFGVLATAFVAGAIFHVAALVSPSLASDSQASGDQTARHALFVVINIVTAIGMLTRPRYFPAIFAILCVQQLASHGDAAHRAWRDEHRIDFASVAVLVVMPLALALLLRDRERARATPLRDS